MNEPNTILSRDQILYGEGRQAGLRRAAVIARAFEEDPIMASDPAQACRRIVELIEQEIWSDG